jgi:alginate O-acetyltransferase complex protein AlgI
MLFQTQSFLLAFLPVTLALYYAAARRPAAREWVIVIASVLFYGAWDARFVPLLIGQTGLTWLAAGAALRTGNRAFLTLGIIANLTLLALFKYAGFLVESVEALTGIGLPRHDIALPIGISFITFELISYLVDVRRGEVGLHRFRAFCLYTFFFPHLVAGPIVRHNELIPQLAADPLREGVAERMGRGLSLLILGLGQKVFLADRLAQIADPVFAPGAALGFGAAWTGALAFSLQLFFDFAAYTDMAIGIALMFGIVLPRNFDTPYRAHDLRDFWRRWHMTLSRWIRDYLYIPLGGSRHGTARMLLASMVAMTLCGLWHGAAWTFVVWGTMHGAGLLIVHGWQHLGGRLPAPLAWLVTMAFVLVGWVLFRAPDFAMAGRFLAAMVQPEAIGLTLKGAPWLIAIAAVLSVVRPTAAEFSERRLVANWPVMVALGALAVAAILDVGEGKPVTFIYFQF